MKGNIHNSLVRSHLKGKVNNIQHDQSFHCHMKRFSKGSDKEIVCSSRRNKPNNEFKQNITNGQCHFLSQYQNLQQIQQTFNPHQSNHISRTASHLTYKMSSPHLSNSETQTTTSQTSITTQPNQTNKKKPPTQKHQQKCAPKTEPPTSAAICAASSPNAATSVLLIVIRPLVKTIGSRSSVIISCARSAR
jgi:hypothetical protein